MSAFDPVSKPRIKTRKEYKNSRNEVLKNWLKVC